MNRVATGFSGHQRQQERESANRQGNFINYLRLPDDGDIAKFRIVSSHEPAKMVDTGINSCLISAVFHRHQQLSKNGREFYTNTLCDREEDEGGNLVGACELCDSKIPRSLQFMVWVYVYDYLHKQQNSDQGTKWPQVKLGELIMYREEMNRFVIWQDGFYSSQALEGRLQRYGSITDRDYMRVRRGARRSQQVRYELDGLEVSSIRPDIVVEAQDLPDLYEVALGKVRTLGGGDAEEPSTYDGPTPTEVSVPDYSLDDLPF